MFLRILGDFVVGFRVIPWNPHMFLLKLKGHMEHSRSSQSKASWGSGVLGCQQWNVSIPKNHHFLIADIHEIKKKNTNLSIL